MRDTPSSPKRITRRRVLRSPTALALASLLPALPAVRAAQPTSAAAMTAADDPYLWLEDVTGDKALAWVRERNAESRPVIEAEPGFADTRDRLREVLDSKERIPYATRIGGHLYNFWRDQANPRGLWRRTTLAEYRKAQPNWELLLDLDALAKSEKENWVWHGVECLGGASSRCLIALSRGGADATVVREFDMASKAFVPGGFSLPEAKSELTWLDENTVLAATDFGPGSLTDSGYPRVVKRWQRGQPLSAAVTVFEGQKADVSSSPMVDHTPGFERVMFTRAIDFYRTEQFLWQDGKLLPLDKPADAQVSPWRERVVIRLRSDWTVGGRTWPQGSLLVGDWAAYLRGERQFQAVFTPSATRSLSEWTVTRHQILLSVMDNVAGRVEAWGPDAKGTWVRREVPAPFPGTLGVSSLHDSRVADDNLGESFFLTYTDFLTPDSLYLGRTDGSPLEKLKARPAFFSAEGMKAEQRFATSKDGTRVPYFVIWPKGAVADGRNPTLLYGYGGFQVSMQPWYSGGMGLGWYRRGGVLVVANIRGGGEFGPGWHQAAIKANKQKSYDDFIAVAEDLIAQKISSPRHLGIEGGSNGGLLVGAVMVQRPDLFNAVVCQVPLLDMKRYHLLLAGASWMAEYGNPDDANDWATLGKISPYQNVKPGVRYPDPFFVTSTRDDRVHPGHARKMVARMREQGHKVYYYENIEGGHGAAADNAQAADRIALETTYLWMRLKR